MIVVWSVCTASSCIQMPRSIGDPHSSMYATHSSIVFASVSFCLFTFMQYSCHVISSHRISNELWTSLL